MIQMMAFGMVMAGDQGTEPADLQDSHLLAPGGWQRGQGAARAKGPWKLTEYGLRNYEPLSRHSGIQALIIQQRRRAGEKPNPPVPPQQKKPPCWEPTARYVRTG